jgi:hypothetical protein
VVLGAGITGIEMGMQFAGTVHPHEKVDVFPAAFVGEEMDVAVIDLLEGNFHYIPRLLHRSKTSSLTAGKEGQHGDYGKNFLNNIPPG